MPARMDRCRCCGCTDELACDEGCSWVRVERGIRMKHIPQIPPLCSVCAGTIADLIEAHRRISSLRRLTIGGFEIAEQASIISRAAVKRWNDRHTKLVTSTRSKNHA